MSSLASALAAPKAMNATPRPTSPFRELTRMQFLLKTKAAEGVRL
jgi:hypothetical protein